VSPWAKRGYVSGQLYEHSSILKFVERRFGLPSLASVNHRFNTSTPALNNDAATGNSGPPAVLATWDIRSEKGTLRAICWSHSACRREAAQVESEGMHVIYT